MKKIFDNISHEMSQLTTRRYSTSFSLGIRFLNKEQHKPIYAIYGFVRFADEIVDTFHKFNKKDLLDRFENDLFHAIENQISLNPILNSFQHTVNKNNIDIELINSFIESMRLDLHKSLYETETEYKKYVYGSADVVGLMCLKVFVKGDLKVYNELKTSAMALGSAFQKVNFLRDLKTDSEDLKRNYFPNVDVSNFDEKTKLKIAAYSLTSQMDLIKGLLESTDQKKNRWQVDYIRDRIFDVSFNLSKISETGNYISNDTATLTLQDLAHILEKFAYTYELFSDEKGIKVEVETSSVSEVEYGIPLGSLKVMLHHLISYCQETYEPQELKFEISEGRQSQTMREVQFTILASVTGNLEDLNLARFNKVMESKLNFETGAPHTNLIKAVLSSLPGSIKATLIGNKVRMDISFLVEPGEAA